MGQKKLNLGARFGSQNGTVFWPPKLVCLRPLIKILIWGSFSSQRGPVFRTKIGSISGPIFWQKNKLWGKKMSISGPHSWTQFLPPQDFWPYYVATFVSLELGPFCAVNRVLTVQTTLDSRVLVLSQQCPKWQATYNGQNVAEATLVERGFVHQHGRDILHLPLW